MKKLMLGNFPQFAGQTAAGGQTKNGHRRKQYNRSRFIKTPSIHLIYTAALSL